MRIAKEIFNGLNYTFFILCCLLSPLIIYICVVFTCLSVNEVLKAFKLDVNSYYSQYFRKSEKYIYKRISFFYSVLYNTDSNGLFHGEFFSFQTGIYPFSSLRISNNTQLTYNHGKLEGECIRYKEHKDKTKPQEIYVKGIFKNDLPWEGTFLQEKNSNNVFTNEYWDATREENYIIVSYTNGCVVLKQVGK